MNVRAEIRAAQDRSRSHYKTFVYAPRLFFGRGKLRARTVEAVKRCKVVGDGVEVRLYFRQVVNDFEVISLLLMFLDYAPVMVSEARPAMNHFVIDNRIRKILTYLKTL